MIKCSNSGCEYEYCCVHCDSFRKDCTCEKIFDCENMHDAILKECEHANNEVKE